MSRHRRAYRMDAAALFRWLREEAYLRQKGLCHWCGVEMRRDVPPNHPHFLTGDHLIPRYAGGRTWYGNIVAACFKCNTSRTSWETDHRAKDAPPLSAGDDTVHSPFEVLKTR